MEGLNIFIQNIKGDRRIIYYDEAATKQAIILRILSLLGWNTFDVDEVKPEFSVGGRRVDYCLKLRNTNKVFIEVKKVEEELENHQEQLLNYSFQMGIRLAILTNGRIWWFYLPLREGSWEQRKFYAINILEQETEEIVQKLDDFLSKENISNGSAIQKAETIYQSQQRKNKLRETLPKAWNKIVTEIDEILIDLISDITENLCGFRPNTDIVEQFFVTNQGRLTIPISSRITPKPVRRRPQKPTLTPPPKPPIILMSYSGKSISAFYFQNTRYQTRSWRDLLMKLLDILYSSHSNEFELVLNLRGRLRPYFTRNPNELRTPQKIGTTDIYVENNLSANTIVRRCYDLLAMFGYSSNDLRLDVN